MSDLESRIGVATIGNTGLAVGGVIGNRLSCVCVGWGRRAVYNTYESEGRGLRKVILNTFQCEGRGLRAIMRSFTAQGRGIRRIANDALTRFELFRGVDAAPDFTAAAWETYTSEPHETAALAADHTYHFVLRRRNKYGVLDLNLGEWVVEVDAAGNAVATRPSVPVDISIEPAVAGAVRLQASYYYLEDGTDKADTWLIYLTDDGADPVPGVDVPIEVSMDLNEGVEALDYTSGGYADGLTIKAIVMTRRSGAPDVDSLATAVVSTTSDTDGPAAVTEHGIFFGDEYKQGQNEQGSCGGPI